MSLEVRFFKKAEKKLLLESIDSLWVHNHVYVRMPEVMDHLVLNTPWRTELTKEDEYAFTGMWLDGEVVGLQGVIPQEANILGKTVKSQTGTIWVVRKSKGKSVDGMCMDEYPEKIRNWSFAFGLGLSKRAAQIYKIRGGWVCDDVPRWIAINDLNNFQKVFDISEQIVPYLPLSKSCLSFCDYVMETDRLDKVEWDEFYAEVMAPVTIGICRDYKFLHWRYFESPVLRYHTIAVRDKSGKYLGLAVLRIEEILDGRFKLGRILEFIAFDIEASVNLANEILKFDSGVLFWDFYCLSDLTVYGLETVGFRKVPSWDNMLNIPSRFHPIDNKITKLNLAVLLKESLREYIDPLKQNQWYITRGDADQDRAN